MKTTQQAVLTLVGLLATTSAGVCAGSWNISTEYSATSNPSGAWSYGRKWTVDATAMDLFTVRWGDNGWFLGNWGHGGPGVYAGPSLWAKHNNNGYPCGRWTCPRTGRYNIRGRFTGTDSRGVYSEYGWTDVDAVISEIGAAPRIDLHPTNRNEILGATAIFRVTVSGDEPRVYQWRKGTVDLSDGGRISGAITATLTISNVELSDEGGYSVIVANAYGTAISSNAVLTVKDSFHPAVNGLVQALAIQPDGRLLLGGSFTELGGLVRSRLARLNVNGTVDTAFDPGADASVICLAVQADGRIVAGGDFTELGGQPRERLARFYPDGTLDYEGFDPTADDRVYCLALQADASILVGGRFATLGGESRACLARLNPDGSLDDSFDPGAGGDFSRVYCLAVQPDGRILVGGEFTALAGQSRTNLGRLHADGTLDTSFDPEVDDTVFTVAVQPDGKILLGGSFSTVAGEPRGGIARLNPDGSVDASFVPPAADEELYSLALQADGRILIGGEFQTLEGQPVVALARLHTDGRLDESFQAAVSGGDWPRVGALAIQPNGGVVVAGDFTELGASPCNGLGGLSASEPAVSRLSVQGTQITWMRGGTSPEVWRTTFDVSTNGVGWLALGAGERVTGGWRLTAPNLPAEFTLRARGFVSGGRYNGSAWFVEEIVRPLRLGITLAGGVPKLRLHGVSGRRYDLEYTAELGGINTWQPRTTVLLTNATQAIPEASVIGENRGFFRARELE